MKLILLTSMLCGMVMGLPGQTLEELVHQVHAAQQRLPQQNLSLNYFLYDRTRPQTPQEKNHSRVVYQDGLHYTEVDSVITIIEDGQSLILDLEDHIALFQPAPPVSFSMLQSMALDSMDLNGYSLIQRRSEGELTTYVIALKEHPAYEEISLAIDQRSIVREITLRARGGQEWLQIEIEYLPTLSRAAIRDQYSLRAFLSSTGKNAQLKAPYDQFDLYNQFQP